MLHEHAMGHTLTAAIWPGLFGLRALLLNRGVRAGVWIGLQGLAYLYTGVFVGLIALVIRPRFGLLAALLPMAPYLAVLAPQLELATAVPPPDGFTSLPLNALWAASSQPQLQLHPFWVLAFLSLVMGNRRTRSLRLRMLACALGLEGCPAPEAVAHLARKLQLLLQLRVPGLEDLERARR